MIEQFLKRKIIPVITIDDSRNAEPVTEALLEGGVDIIEVTLRTPASIDSISRIRKQFPEIILGAGTVVNTLQAKQAIDLGINFGVAPGLNPAIVDYFQKQNTPFLPGVMTPSEIEFAMSLNCRLLKFFPAHHCGGIKGLEALAGPYTSHEIKFCPTGGINRKNMTQYLASKLVFAIGGSWLANPNQIDQKLWKEITVQTRDTMVRVKEA